MTGSFVAGDYLVCVKCGSPTCPRGRNPDHGTRSERRQFECVKCDVLVERRATLLGYVDPMREPDVQGWLNSALTPPN
jgi:hypothetical protein